MSWAKERRMAMWLPFRLMYMGSFKGAIWTSSTLLPGKHPSSKSFMGSTCSEKSLMIPFCPNAKSITVATILI